MDRYVSRSELEDFRKKERGVDFTFGLTNATSLWQKVESLKEMIEEGGQAFSVVTETWFHMGPPLDELKATMKNVHHLESIDRMRKRKGSANPGGGVSIVFDPSRIKLKEYPVKRRGHKIIAAVGKLPNNTRKIYIIGVYISTKLKADKYHECLETLNEVILKIKTETVNPYLVLAGDFNKKDVGEAIDDFPDMALLDAGPTRSTATLDICATNFHTELITTTNHPPLESNIGTSDHNYISYKFRLEHRHKFHWKYVKTRKTRPNSKKGFVEAVKGINWEEALPATLDVNSTTETVHKLLYKLTESFFPSKWIKIRSTDDPWIDQDVRDKIEIKKAVFYREGRSEEWKVVKRITDAMIVNRKRKYYNAEVVKLKAEGSHQIPYKILRNITDTERPPEWSIESMLQPNKPGIPTAGQRKDPQDL